MKKFISILIFFSLTSFCFSFSKPGKSEKNIQVVTGIVKTFGNEPFTFLGIITDSDKHYSLKADVKMLEELKKTESSRIEIKGTINKSDNIQPGELKDGSIIVIEWKQVK